MKELINEAVRIGGRFFALSIRQNGRAKQRLIPCRLHPLTRTASEKVVEGKESLPWKPREDELGDALGRKVSRHEMAGDVNPPGVVTGLAWTPVGGEILFIEATNMPGSGETILTGQLGDVMKESARISLSLLRSRLPLGAVDFKKSDLHIHVPAGSTPKDGPSAGIALFTALASLMTGRSVDSRLAMTGEITLRGQVMPIGGVKEKLLGAQRAGIKRVLLPLENKDDMKDVPAEVKETIEVVFVETIEDVLREALGINIPKLEQMVALHASQMQPMALLTE
ncbi:S16 family serine protease [Selenomonas sp. TAMA-11512]|uniref:S16 family serine protease n=1 Tax=Selenomonas sp. TAMA-11512 TaxID=3095337 RepID=UPI0030CACA89